MRFSISRSGFSKSSSSCILDDHAVLAQDGLDLRRQGRVRIDREVLRANDDLLLRQEQMDEERRVSPMLLADAPDRCEHIVRTRLGHPHAYPARERRLFLNTFAVR